MTNAVGAGVRIQNHYRDIRELIKSYFPGIVGNVMANKIAVFMPCKEESFDYEQRIEMIEKSRELARKLRAKADVVFRIGIGSVKSIKVTCMLAGVLACVIFIALQIKNRKDRAKKGYELNSLSGTIAKTVVICAAVLAFMYKLALHKGIPYVLVWVAVIVLIYSYITSKTTTGRYFYAVGGNEKVTKLSGINTNKVYFLAYLNMAFLAAVAGMITIARLNSANPTAGTNYEMDAIGSCFIGGASAYGGTGTVPGVIVGAILMGVINLGMNIMGVDANYQKVVKGLVLLAAVIFDVVSKKKQS